MQSDKYWAKRAELRMEGYSRKGEEIGLELTEGYKKAMQRLNAECESVMRSFQNAYGLSEAEARAILKNAGGKTADSKLKKALKNAMDRERAKKLQAMIDAPAYKFRMARLEKTLENVEEMARSLYGEELRRTRGFYRELYHDAYMRTIFDVQQGTGYGFSFATIDPKRVDAVLSRKWSKEHFSQRIWANTCDLEQKIKEELLVGVLTGRSTDKTTNEIAVRCGVGASNAKRLVRTESTYIASQAELDSYEECDIEYYRYLATIDTRTSAICSELDGKKFPCKDAKPGVNYPPMHPNCRSTTVAVFDDDVEGGLMRRARDPETGKTYLVDGNTTYEKWRKQQEDLHGTGYLDRKRKMEYNKETDKEQFEAYKNLLGENAPRSFVDFQSIKYSDDWKAFKAYSRSIKSGELTPLADFALYKSTSVQIDDVLVGKNASNGLVISGKSDHFIARTIGSVEQRRNGVSVYDELRTLTTPIKVDAVCINGNDYSQRFIGDCAAVTINPKTGKLIQVNPLKDKERRR